MKPSWKYHTTYLKGIKQIFSLYQSPNPETRNFIACVLLVKNSTTLLSGLYGTGKTQLIHIIRKTFFRVSNGYDFGYVTCSQDLTPHDTLYYLDLPFLMKGREVVIPRKIITARLKFINEIQRANSLVYNALLPLLSERLVTYRDQLFSTPDFLCFLDKNPFDTGSTEIPQAFKDRIDYSFIIPQITTNGIIRYQETLFQSGDSNSMLADHAEPFMISSEFNELWNDVCRIQISNEIKYLCALISGYLKNCTQIDRSVITPEYCLPCDTCLYRSEACSKLGEIPGLRFVVSMLNLAQARAWLRKSDRISVDDLLFGLPYVLNHRLKVKMDSARLYPNLIYWIKKEVYNQIRLKIPKWRQVFYIMNSSKNMDKGVLRSLAQSDRVLSGLMKVDSSLKSKSM